MPSPLSDALRFGQRERTLTLYAYVLMENHLHLIASAPELSKVFGGFKSYTARQIIDRLRDKDAAHVLDQLAFHRRPYKLDREYQLWQEGSHPQEIVDEAMMRQKIA